MFMIGGSPPLIHAYQAADLSPDVSFQMEEGPRPVWQTVPAADGKLWVLGRSPAVEQEFWLPANASYSLLRLEADGDLDPTFAARDLPADFSYSLTATAGGGFLLTSDWLGRYMFWPTPTGQSLKFQRFDASGEVVTTVNRGLPFGWNSREVVFQAPDLLIYPDRDFTNLVRSQPSSYDPDPAFRILLAAPESPVIGPLQVRTLDEFPDGKLLVGGTRRMLADGSVDATWHIPRLERKATVSRLTRLPDGSVLASGNFDRANGQPVAGVVRLLPDDALDAEFSPPFDFRFATKICPFPDGSLLALFAVPAEDSSGNQSHLAKFSAAGAFISLWPVPEPAGTATFYFGQVTDFEIQSDGTTLLTTFQNGEVPMVGFRRIQPDGSSPWGSDPLANVPLGPGIPVVFPPVPVVVPNIPLGAGLLVLDDDSYLLGNVRYAADGAVIGSLAGISAIKPAAQLSDRSVIFISPWGGGSRQKWHPITGVDGSFALSTEDLPPVVAVGGATHDRLFVTGYSGFVRLHGTGQTDPTFRSPVFGVSDFLAEGNGSVLITGDFEMLDGQPRSGIARLADTRAVGFEAWMAAAAARRGLNSSQLAASADADHDGSSNWLEYAAGTDPVGGLAAQPRPLSVTTWRLPCNPEAPEISRRLETSHNLIDWHAARGDEVRVESNAGCLTWSLLPGAGSLFSRVRVE